MLPNVALGAGLAFAAVVQPGPLQAFLLSRAATDGWKRTLPAAFAPLLSDGPIALLALVVLSRFPLAAQNLLRAAGGALLLYLAWTSLRDLRAAPGDAPEPDVRAAPKTLFQASAVNLLNPNPYLAWALVLGPAALSAWRIHPANAVALLAAFYGVMVVGLAAFIVLAGGARSLPSRARRAVGAAAAAVLAALGLWMLATGLGFLASR